MLSIRDKFFNCMRRKGEEFIPFEFILCPSLIEEFKRRTGETDYAEYFDFPARLLFVEYINKMDKYSRYYGDVEGININDWGVGFKPGATPDFNEMLHPMGRFETLDEFENYPYPDPMKDYDWEGFDKRVMEVKEKDRIAVAYMEVTIFEMAWYLRGMDRFMIDMLAEPELANYLLDRITERRCIAAQMFAAAGCDVLRLGDDVATQLDMMMNPGMWREFFKPRLAKVIKAAKRVNPDIMIFYHGDGNLRKIIPDLIEVGVEILNPIQPECMDPVDIKKTYGEKLSFWGTIGTQTTMPFGSPEDVRKACRRMASEVGKGGGLLLAPTHVLEPEVPWENLEAFVSAVTEYNKTGR